MLPALLIALVLLFLPFPVRFGVWPFALCLGLAAVLSISGVSVMIRFGADGFLFGGLLVLLGVGYVLRAWRMRRNAPLQN